MTGDEDVQRSWIKAGREKSFEGGKAARAGAKKSRACGGGAQSGSSRGIGAADRGKTVPRQTAFDLISRRQSAKPEAPARRGQATLRIAARLHANPFDGPGILLKLSHKDFRGRIRGIMAPRAQAAIHRCRWCLEPKTGKRDASCRGDRGQGLALGWLERYGIDDHRISCGERLGSLSAQRLIDAARHLRRIGARRQPRFGGNSE